MTGTTRGRRSSMAGGGPTTQYQAKSWPARVIGCQIGGGIYAISPSCHPARCAGRRSGAGMRGVHVRTITASIATPAALDSLAGRPSGAGQAASADGSEVPSPSQRQQPNCRSRPGVRPESAAGATGRRAGGTDDRRPDWLLQAGTACGEVPAYLPRRGATDHLRTPGASGETNRSSLGCPVLAPGALSGHRQAAVRLLPDFRGRRGCRLLARLLGDAHSCGRRLHILRERRAPRPVLRPSPLSPVSDLLLSCAATWFGSLGMTATDWHWCDSREAAKRRARGIWRGHGLVAAAPHAGL